MVCVLHMLWVKHGQGCIEPDVLPQRSTEVVVNITRESSFSGLPDWISGQNNGSDIPPNFIHMTETHYVGHRRCPLLHGGSHRRHGVFQHDLAACAYRYVQNTDVNRKPNTLLFAKCLCRYSADSQHLCQEVIRYTNVFRRTGCENGVYVYREVWEPVPVACVATSMPEATEAHRWSFRSPQ